MKACSRKASSLCTLKGQATVWADAELLRRAVSNLLSNAVSHTHPCNTITVTLAGDPDGAATVEVRNPGPGIPTELMSRVFDRFFRVDAAREESHKGSGLGLAIVRSTIELHSGSASVRSGTEKETVFTLRFPGTEKYNEDRMDSSIAAPDMTRASAGAQCVPAPSRFINPPS